MVVAPTPADVAAFMGWPTDDDLIAPHLSSVTTFVRSFIGGRTFIGGQCAEDVAAVIVAATARSVSNPTHAVRVEVGSYNEVPTSFTGFTLVERSVLNRYRLRTA